MTDRRWSGDVIIAGAGPAGSACATFLSRAGLRVLLVDRRRSSQWQPVEIVAPATVQLLRYHRLFEAGTDQGYGVCRGVNGLWSGKPAFLDYELFACDAAVAVDRRVFDDELTACAAASGAHVIVDTVVERAVRETDATWTVSLTTTGGRSTARAAVVVESVGRVARNLGMAAGERRYFDRLMGLACPIPLPSSEYQIMLLEADSQGWWYSSCDARGHGAAVYLSDADLLPRTPARRERFFRRKFASSRLIRRQLPALPETLDLRTIDARTSLRTHLCTRASLAIGDAAYSVDPLSGGGIRRAVETALHAAQAVTAFLGTHDTEALDRYEVRVTSDFERCLRDKDGVYANANPSLLTQPFWQRRIAPWRPRPLDPRIADTSDRQRR